MQPDLSIIIPCYNCSKTLKQAFDSCFRQNLTINYEIVMVDDYSTDNTREIIKELSVGHNNIVLEFHKQNRGGGATRNTAVKNASAQIIFCLDSDDILQNGTLEKMYNLIKSTKSDGVGIQTSIKFSENDTKKVSFINEFGYVGKKIPFESLIEKDNTNMCSLYSTFMFTKKAFEIVGGYPEGHGFDTQSFAWRFLANGLTAYTCPNAQYFHRINFTKSYYIREYESGKINHNWYKTLEEFLYLFDRNVQKEIMYFDLNSTTKVLLNSIKKFDKIFKDGYENLVTNNTSDQYEKYLSNVKEISREDKYWLGTKKFSTGKFSEAFDIFEFLIKDGVNTGYTHYYLQKCSELSNRESKLIDQKKIDQP